MLKSFWIALAFIAAGSFGSTPALADSMDCPGGMQPTVQSLQQCVQHAADTGMIDNAGVASSLLGKLHAAELVLRQNNPNAAWTAINILGAFIGEVEAQAGKHIDAGHAHHMAMHAQMVIDALRATSSTPTSAPR
jgi:hypothetical protein